MLEKVLAKLYGSWPIKRRLLQKYAKQNKVGDALNEWTLNKEAKLAIIVPCFNHLTFLPATLDSIKNQSQKPNEVIFIDDCSPDDTGAYLEKKLSSFDEQVDARLLKNEKNIGQAASINKAVESSSSDWFMILNDDDLIHTKAVSTVRQVIAKTKIHLFGFGCKEIKVDTNYHDVHWPELPNIDMIALPKYQVSPVDVLNYKAANDLNMTHSGSTFSKFAFQQVGGYYENKLKRVVPFSDRDFQLRVASVFLTGDFSEIQLSAWREGSSVDHGKNS